MTQLQRTLGPVVIWGLGVGYVISGMYFGWNLGLPAGGPYGMLVATDRALEVGENMIVSFRATQLGLWFDTEATVARIIKGRRPGDRGPAIGLSFSTLDRVKRLILRGHLRRVPPHLPRRTQRIDWTATIRSLA